MLVVFVLSIIVVISSMENKEFDYDNKQECPLPSGVG